MFCRSVERTAAWGGEPELTALAGHLQRPITVYAVGSQPLRFGPPPSGEDSGVPRLHSCLLEPAVLHQRKLGIVSACLRFLRAETSGLCNQCCLHDNLWSRGRLDHAQVRLCSCELLVDAEQRAYSHAICSRSCILSPSLWVPRLGHSSRQLHLHEARWHVDIHARSKPSAMFKYLIRKTGVVE